MKLQYLSYFHSSVYAALLYFAYVDRNDQLVTILGWSHGILWIVMSVLCLAAVRRGVIPLWLGVTVAVLGGIGPFAGSVGFLLFRWRSR